MNTFKQFNNIANKIYNDIISANNNNQSEIIYENNLIPYADNVIIVLKNKKETTNYLEYGGFLLDSLKEIYSINQKEKRYKTCGFYFNISEIGKIDRIFFINAIFHEIMHSYQELNTIDDENMHQHKISYMNRKQMFMEVRKNNNKKDDSYKAKELLLNILYYISPVEMNAHMSYYYSRIINLDGNFNNVIEIKDAVEKEINIEDNFMFLLLLEFEQLKKILEKNDENLKNVLLDIVKKHTAEHFNKKFKSFNYFMNYIRFKYIKMLKKMLKLQDKAIYQRLKK